MFLILIIVYVVLNMKRNHDSYDLECDDVTTYNLPLICCD